MEIISGTTEFKLDRETAVAIGKFDGVHIGHRRLLEEILEQKRNGLAACVFTFDPPPSVFFGGLDGGELTTREEKRLLFETLGVDILIEFPLNAETAAILPENFVREILVKKMNARLVAAGTDLSFGAKGAGNAILLHHMGQVLGFEVKTIEKVSRHGTVVNSSYIRELLKQGKLQQVKDFLGMPYTIRGKVVHGNRIGRTLGFPTVNLIPEKNKLLPPCGVYFSMVGYGGRYYRAISNVGYKPTVTEERILGVESYLYDFNQEIYDEMIEVSLHAFMRQEQRFDSLEELKEQLQRDMLAGMDLI